MRALAATEHGTLEVVDRPDPAPGPGQGVVAVARAGICGSDLHLLGTPVLAPGTVMGHEIAGTVVALGADVPAGLAVGARVAVMPATRCGGCPCCAAGRSVFLCAEQQSRWLGLGAHDGGYAEYVRVPAGSLYRLPDELSVASGALIEPYAVALHAVRRSRVTGDPNLAVGVVGGGAIGLMTVGALFDAGVERVALAEPGPVRADIARAMGVPTVVASTHDLPDALGRRPDVIVDCSGAAAVPGDAIDAITVGGEVVLVGVVPWGTPMPMPGAAWVMKEVDVVSSIAYTEDEFADALAAAGRGAVHEDVVVSSVLGLDDGQAAFDELRGPAAPAKIQLAP